MNAIYFAALSLAAAASGTTYTFTVQGGGDGVDGSTVVLDSGNSFLKAGDGQAVTWADNGEVMAWNGNQALTSNTFFLKVGDAGDSASNFGVNSDGTFTYLQSTRFFVCTGNANDIAFWANNDELSETFKNSCNGYTEVKLHAQASGEASSSAAASSKAPATSAAASSEAASSAASAASSAATTAAASSAAAGETSVVEETVVETVCTHETCTGVAPANGAARNAVFGGVAAIAAALL